MSLWSKVKHEPVQRVIGGIPRTVERTRLLHELEQTLVRAAHWNARHSEVFKQQSEQKHPFVKRPVLNSTRARKPHGPISPAAIGWLTTLPNTMTIRGPWLVLQAVLPQFKGREVHSLRPQTRGISSKAIAQRGVVERLLVVGQHRSNGRLLSGDAHKRVTFVSFTHLLTRPANTT